jgi:hypothetical protein
MSKAVLSSVVTAVTISLATTAMATNPPGKSGTGNPGQAVVAQVVDPDDYAAPVENPTPAVVAQVDPDDYAADAKYPAQAMPGEAIVAQVRREGQALVAQADADEYAARPLDESAANSNPASTLMAQGYSESNEIEVEAAPQRRGNAFVRTVNRMVLGLFGLAR